MIRIILVTTNSLYYFFPQLTSFVHVFARITVDLAAWLHGGGGGILSQESDQRPDWSLSPKVIKIWPGISEKSSYAGFVVCDYIFSCPSTAGVHTLIGQTLCSPHQGDHKGYNKVWIEVSEEISLKSLHYGIHLCPTCQPTWESDTYWVNILVSNS